MFPEACELENPGVRLLSQNWHDSVGIAVGVGFVIRVSGYEVARIENGGVCKAGGDTNGIESIDWIPVLGGAADEAVALALAQVLRVVASALQVFASLSHIIVITSIL